MTARLIEASTERRVVEAMSSKVTDPLVALLSTIDLARLVGAADTRGDAS